MATTTTTLSLLLSLFLSSLFLHGVSGYTINVNFHNNFDVTAKSLYISCKENDHLVIVQVLGPRKDYLLLAIDSKSYVCTAKWEQHVAAFTAYSAQRDGTNTKVFWNVDQTGWYLSYDGATFTKQAGWI